MATLLLMAQGTWAQGVLTTDAMIRMAEQKAKVDEKLEQTAMLAQLGISVEIIDHRADESDSREAV